MMSANFKKKWRKYDACLLNEERRKTHTNKPALVQLRLRSHTERFESKVPRSVNRHSLFVVFYYERVIHIGLTTGGSSYAVNHTLTLNKQM